MAEISEIRDEVRGELQHGIERLRLLRDEMRLHIHLASMEARQRLGGLEKELEELEHAAHTAGEGVRGLVTKLGRSFDELRQAIATKK